MKRTITFSLLLAIAFCIALVNPLKAQNNDKDMNALAKKFENAYNRKDAKALKGMYTKDAVRTNTDGTVTTGNAAISDSLAKGFKDSKTIMIKIKVDKSVTESDGSITATGTYHVTGKSTKGEKIDAKGAFNNINVKEGGTWKISKSVLTSK
ncbi:MAG TPA: nuclear transport factor 2 family protein [Ginsengibacter sp.]